jgi:hypothetical protein
MPTDSCEMAIGRIYSLAILLDICGIAIKADSDFFAFFNQAALSNDNKARI